MRKRSARTIRSCSSCSFWTLHHDCIKNHMRCHNIQSAHQCPHCSFSVPSIAQLGRHVSRCHPEVPKQLRCSCSSCGFTASTAKDMRRHEERHKVKAAYPCPFCSFSSAMILSLRNHVLAIHAGQSKKVVKTALENVPSSMVDKLKVEKVQSMRKRIQVMEEKVRVAAEELKNVVLKLDEVKERIGEVSCQVETLQSKEQLFDLLQLEKEELLEDHRIAKDSHVGVMQVVRILQTELKKLLES